MELGEQPPRSVWLAAHEDFHLPIRRLLRSVVPRRWRPRALAMRFVLEHTAGVVQAGPFAGMRYPAPGPDDWYFPQILGSYERELVPVLDRLLALDPVERIVIAGAAEGYYAVGLARKLAQARVVAFEAEPARRAKLEVMAAGNDVTLEVRGLCDLGALAQQLDAPQDTLLIVDIEGGEALLLDPDVLPALRSTRMLVEVHDFFVPEVGDTLKRRFSASHRIESIEARPRFGSDLPNLSLPWRRLLENSYRSLLSEGRPASSYWLSLAPSGGRS